MPSPRTIYVGSAGFGEGHHAAARGLVAAFERLLGNDPLLRAEFLDLNARVFPRRDRWTKRGYLALLSRAPRVWAAIYQLIDRVNFLEATPWAFRPLWRELGKMFAEQPPAALVATFPFYGFVLDRLAAEGGPSGFPRAMVVTDSISINSVWTRSPGTDVYYVPNDETADAMAARGVPRNKLRALGFPVHPRYSDPPAEARPPVDDPAAGRRVLFIINSQPHLAPAVTRALLGVPGVRLTVTAGRDPALREAVQAEAARAPQGGGELVEVLGWTDRIPDLLRSHHLVVSKAGGATVQEAIAAGCPMVLSQVAPGQEEGNAQLLLSHRAGATALGGPADVAAAVSEAFAGNAARWTEWSANLARLSRPAAALDIAREVLAMIAAGATSAR